MSTLWVYFGESCYCHRFQSMKENETFTIGNHIQSTITFKSFPLESVLTITKSVNKNSLYVLYEEELVGEIIAQKPIEINIGSIQIRFLLDDLSWIKQSYYIDYHSEIEVPITIYENQAQACFLLLKANNKWLIKPIYEEIYINGEQISDMHELKVGDVIYYPSAIMVYYEEDVILVEGNKYAILNLPRIKLPTSVLKEKYPNYRRTPRMIYDLPSEKVNFALPDRKVEHNQRELWFIILPPLVMLIIIGVIMMIRPRGIFVIMSIAMFTMTIITSTVQYFKERNRVKEENKKRKKLYSKYLVDKRNELQILYNKQCDVLYYHFPDFERMKYLTNEISNRIWERTLSSHDFLQVRVGRATVPASYTISNQQSEIANREIDELLESFQELVSFFRKIKNVPLTIDLLKGSIGMIGKEETVKREIRQILGQISFFQSYHDVRFVAIFDESEYEDWQWVKWLPHFQLPHMYARGFIYNEKTRDQLLSSIFELLKERDLDEEKGKKRFSPHLVFIVTNQQLISEHAILPYLERGSQSDIGMTTIFAADRKESLTENINTLVRYIDEKHGEILIRNNKAEHIPFSLDPYYDNGNEKFARTLFSLNHELGMKHSIPEKVTFLEMFEIEDVSELHIKEKWDENDSTKSLAVPVGLKSKEDLVYLNLHEKAHGPHGLLAGTTGSGKSEFLQTFILSLAVHFHPHEASFLLIDYKGGGMAQPFRKIPHLLGTITNIEGSKNFSKRALESIKSELKRRQRLFEKFEVNHINGYMQLYKRNIATEPLPHLFLISDEFAELKSEEPEFIKELVSAARIGRSLGVHLILATQKPGGVIDNQIWSNSRFKVALKVQDESDSKEILKNSDAANITVTGRGYLQVGNNEIYELFQSAWSGAPYEKDIVTTEDEVALVTDLGLIPLSEVTTEESNQSLSKTEIEVVTNEIVKVSEQLKIKKVPSPWLPPLPERMVHVKNNNVDGDQNRFLIAVTDEPELQRQRDYYFEAVEDGNIGIFGSSGYGKSVTVLTILLSIARRKSPEEFQFYIFDFGNGALLPLRHLPHTGDYFLSDEQRKIEKFFAMITKEIEKRKELFQEYEVSHINLYNTIAPHKLPIIYIIVDNYDLIRDEMLDLENEFVQLSRDGQSLGLFIILTASRNGAVRHAMQGNLKTKIVHYLVDTAEKNTIIGKTSYEIEPIPGRAYIKKDTAYLSQILLPSDGKTDIEMLENIKKEIRNLRKIYRGAPKPLSIPMLPRSLDQITFKSDYKLKETATKIAIGLDEVNVKPIYIDLQLNRHLLVIGDSQSGKTNILKLIIRGVLHNEDTKIGLCDSINRSLTDFMNEDQVSYIDSKEQLNDWIQAVETELETREERYRILLHENRRNELNFTPIILIVDEINYFKQKLDRTTESKIVDFIRNRSHLGFNFIVTGPINDLSKGFDPLTSEMKQIKQVLLLMKKSEQSFINLPYVRNEPELPLGYAYYILNNNDTKVLIPEYIIKKEASIT